MDVVIAPSKMQRLALGWRRRGVRVGFVPTMGFLHEGHLTLIRRARREVGPRGKVVLSIFVNPAQFGPREDFGRYPRDFARDCNLCRKEGVDAIFAPAAGRMFPAGESDGFSTWVVEEKLAATMEGVSRPGHFRGVTTVVAKLFNLVLPDVAVFGAKDYQQAAVIRRMVRDLNFPLKLVVAPTLREKDGLAMSSRNKYLRGRQRHQARVLSSAIRHARTLVRNSKRPLSAARLKKDIARLVAAQPEARLDYAEFFDSKTLEPLREVARGTRLALAVHVGPTRLIDNAEM